MSQHICMIGCIRNEIQGACRWRAVAAGTIRIFGDGRLYCRRVMVRNCESFGSISGNGRSIAIDAGDFFCGIDNLSTALHLIQIIPGVCPVSIAVQRYRITRCLSISIELNLYAFRTDAILVVSIIPDFRDCYAGLSRSIGIRDVIAGDLSTVIRYSIFNDRIGDLMAISVLRKIREGILPFAMAST